MDKTIGTDVIEQIARVIAQQVEFVACDPSNRGIAPPDDVNIVLGGNEERHQLAADKARGACNDNLHLVAGSEAG
jgi:hypothetical protein